MHLISHRFQINCCLETYLANISSLKLVPREWKISKFRKNHLWGYHCCCWSSCTSNSPAAARFLRYLYLWLWVMLESLESHKRINRQIDFALEHERPSRIFRIKYSSEAWKSRVTTQNDSRVCDQFAISRKIIWV